MSRRQWPIEFRRTNAVRGVERMVRKGRPLPSTFGAAVRKRRVHKSGAQTGYSSPRLLGDVTHCRVICPYP
jgi:hypothetical protein